MSFAVAWRDQYGHRSQLAIRCENQQAAYETLTDWLTAARALMEELTREEEPTERQRLLTLDEIKFLMVLWGGMPMFASDEPGGCEGEATDLREHFEDDDLLDYPMGSLEAGPADRRCQGWPVYTFGASVTSFCADHCRLKIRQLQAEAKRRSIDLDQRLATAFASSDFPDDISIQDAVGLYEDYEEE